MHVLSKLLPSRNIVILEDQSLVHQGFLNGTCNTYIHESPAVQEYIVRSMGYKGEYAISSTPSGRETVTLFTRSDDHEFSAFVNVVIHALLEAEKCNITQRSAGILPPTDIFGDDYKDMFQNAVGAGGNYGEIYNRYMEQIIPRDSIALNRMNDGSTGQMMSVKFGDVTRVREGPLSSTMQIIQNRGTLRCGVRINRPGFATGSPRHYEGIEYDYCRALSASLFQGRHDQVEIVPFEEQEDGFQLLAYQVDVIAGVTWNLANWAHEPSTGAGYSFSSPYFYGYSNQEDNFVLATRSDDHDWSSFVYWIASALVYAEEQNIDAASSNSMPEVFLYGTEMKRIFRDAVLAVGSYGEMYERHLESLYPRSGRNLLNTAPNLGPQFHSIPGLRC